MSSIDPFVMLVVLLYGAATALTIWLFFYSDTENEGVKGSVSRLFLERFPKATKWCITKACGDNSAAKVWGCFDWVVNQRNPLLQILYHIILFGAFIAWLWYGEPLLPTYLIKTPPHSKYEAHIGISLCLFTWVLANFTGPGNITKKNLSCYSHHHFDQLIFTDDVICGTCDIPKPARSKHCSLCGHCVPKFDHHCIWLNQCVGEHNYKYFLLFLVVHSSVFLYFGTLLIGIILSPVVEHKMWEMTYKNPNTGDEWNGARLVISYLLNHSTALIILALMAIMFGLTILAFLVYHLYLIAKGMTTNESYKWASCQRLYDQLRSCHQNYLDALADGVQFEFVTPENEEGDGDDDGDGDGDGDGEGEGQSQPSIEQAYGKVNRISKGPERRHFVRQMVEQDELPYYLVVHPGPRPHNTYNKGFWANLHAVVFPPSVSLLAQAAAAAAATQSEMVGRGGSSGSDVSAESVSPRNSGDRGAEGGVRRRQVNHKGGKKKKR